jgi:hypothetical protein
MARVQTGNPKFDARPEWVNYLEYRLDTRIFKDGWQFWLTEMAEPYPEGFGQVPSNQEILSALKWIKQRQDRGEAGNIARNITLNKLIKIIAWYRKTLREAQEPEHQNCALCCDGWITYYPKLSEQISLIDVLYALPVKVPCLCSRGQQWLAKYYQSEELQYSTRKKAEKGKRQMVALG